MDASPVIYQPNGAAGEYAALACNLYRGCIYGCLYCYVPGCVRRTRTDFHATAEPRKDILARLERDAKRMRNDPRPVMFCFTCDPYQPCEAEHKLMPRALEILHTYGMRARILTKNGDLAMRDIDLFSKHHVEVGVSLSWHSEAKREQWEPHAGTLAKRCALLALCGFHGGITRWVSVEPVIEPEEALSLLRVMSHEPRWADIVKVGKLNHMPEIERAIDWTKFLHDALHAMEGMRYYIKRDLWAFADPHTVRCHSRMSFNAETDRAWVL